MDATSKQPDFNVYSDSKKSSNNIFYGSEIKKDSEIQFSNRDVQRLLLDRGVRNPSPSNDSQGFMIKAHSQMDNNQPLDASFMDQNHARSTPHSEPVFTSQSQPAVSSGSLDSHASYMDQLQEVNSAQASDSQFKASQSKHPAESSHSNGNSETGLSASVTSISDTVYPPHTNLLNTLDSRSQNSDTDAPQAPSQSSMVIKSHVCLTCYKTFRNKPQLNQHELVHNGVRKHVCTYCDKAFKQVCHLNQHIRVHTGERPYKCNLEGCGRSFAQLSNLNHHQKNHEEHVRRDISRQYRCDVCERSYANQTSLHTHIQKLHTNVKGVEGTPSCPILLSAQPTRKRKKKIKNVEQTSSDNGTCETFTINLIDSDDDGLPTQVKTSNLSGKTTYTIKLDTSGATKRADGSSVVYSQGQNSPMMERFEERTLSAGNQGISDVDGDSLIIGQSQQQGQKLGQSQMPGFLTSGLLAQHPTLQQTVKNLQQRETTSASSNGRAIFCPPFSPVVHPAHLQSPISPPPPPLTLAQLQAQSLHLPVSETQATHISHHFPESSALVKDQRLAAEQRFGQSRFRSEEELGAERITAERLLVDAGAADQRFHDERILEERLVANNQRSSAERRQNMVDQGAGNEHRQRSEHRSSTEQQQQRQQQQQQLRSVDQKQVGDDRQCVDLRAGVDHRDLRVNVDQRSAAAATSSSERRQQSGHRGGSGQRHEAGQRHVLSADVGARQGAGYPVFNPAFTEQKNRAEHTLYGQKQT